MGLTQCSGGGMCKELSQLRRGLGKVFPGSGPGCNLKGGS